jgi:arylsulfatase A-like enzyme
MAGCVVSDYNRERPLDYIASLCLQAAARLLLSLAVVLFVLLNGRPARAEEGPRPNIVFVLLDNVGWGEFGCYGGGVLRGAPTPNIDALAAEGMRLTNFNVEASCTPTRSALMTGRYSVRSGTLRTGASGLVKWEVTLPELLKKQGYTTAHYGKWHLGDEEGRYPVSFGFDEWYGIARTSNEALNETSPGYDPAAVAPLYIMEGKAGGRSTNVKVYNMEARRNIDADLIDKTIAFASANAAAKKPFFAYVPMTQVHYPSVPSAAFAGKTGKGDFADSMVQTDYLVGKLVHAIDAMGIAQNTLIVLASDNGPEYRRPWRGTAGYWSSTYHTMMEGGLRTPAIIRWSGTVKPGNVSDGMVHAVDLFTTLAHVGRAEVPNDRPIDGVDQMALFTGANPNSARDGFPIYIEGEEFGAKFRDWKYHIVWKPDAEKPSEKPAIPYLFNITVDPKEESPRLVRGPNAHLEDAWVMKPFRKIMNDMRASLAANPPVPFGASVDYVPRAVPVNTNGSDPSAPGPVE